MTTNKKDSIGQDILAGSIVSVQEECNFKDQQGFVVNPHSDQEGPQFCVAVFFGKELYNSYFSAYSSEIEDWDTDHAEQLRTGDLQFLLQDENWKTCPRIVFFKPEHLLVETHWRLRVLAKRIFPRTMHILYELPNGVSQQSSEYVCFIKECNSVATKLALFNMWGAVYPMHVCDSCFLKTNGWSGDDVPTHKKPLLKADGTPVNKE